MILPRVLLKDYKWYMVALESNIVQGVYDVLWGSIKYYIWICIYIFWFSYIKLYKCDLCNWFIGYCQKELYWHNTIYIYVFWHVAKYANFILVKFSQGNLRQLNFKFKNIRLLSYWEHSLSKGMRRHDRHRAKMPPSWFMNYYLCLTFIIFL